MGLLDGLKRRRELDALRRALRDRPSADAVLALADKQHAHGQADAAVTTCRDGLRSFPRSEKLFARYVFLRRQQVSDRLRKLKTRLAQMPSPECYGELIELYLDLDEIERALDLCRTCIERFPDSELGYRQAGRIRLWRWRQDRLARDGRRAIALLKQAADRTSAESLRLLAELYLQVGAHGPARRALASIERFAPGDPTVGELMVRAEALGTEAGAGAAAGGVMGEGEIDDQLEQIERGAPLILDDARLLTGLGARVQPPSQADAGDELDRDALDRGFGELSRLGGFACALLVDSEGRTVALKRHDPASDEEGWRSLTVALLELSRDATMRTDLGRFYRGQLDGPKGPVLLAQCTSYGLGCYFNAALDVGTGAEQSAWDVVERLVSDAFGG